MQLEVSKYELPQAISFNYDEIKQELTAKVEMYKTLVYTEDQVSSAKKDRASLNAFKKTLNDERIRLEKEYLEPFNDFKAKINELIKTVDEPVAIIDKQIKDYEAEKKASKRKEVEELWATKTKPEWLNLSQIWDEKWLNTSVTMKAVETSIDNELARIDNEVNSIQQLGEFAFEAEQIYHSTLSLPQAIAEGQRLLSIQKAKEAEAARKEAEKQVVISEPHEGINEEVATKEAPEEEKMIVRFEAEMTLSQAKELNIWFKQHGISIKQI